MLRRAAAITAGLAMATACGLAGAGTASAAAPALKIKPGATWTIEVNGGGCELEVFNTTTHHFTSDAGGDKGTWSGGGSTVGMTWKHGADAGLKFSGTFVVGSSPKEYTGSFSVNFRNTGQLVKGAVAGC